MERQTHGIVLFGLSLCSGIWDEAESCLKPLSETESELVVRNTYCAVINFKFREQAQTAKPTETKQCESQIYKCPVLISNTKLQNVVPHFGGKSHSPLFHVPLAAMGDCSGIFLLCDSEFHDVYM